MISAALLQDAAEWRLIGLLFECPGAGWHAQVAALAREVADHDLKAAAGALGVDATPSRHQTTFGPGGPAAPREVSHRATIMPGQMLEQIGAYYKAFAYRPSVGEPPDHVAVMAGFVAYLRLKEAYAVERGDAVQAAVAAEAAGRFIDDHLNTVAEPLAASLAGSGIPYLAHAATALLRRAGPRRQVATGRPPPAAGCDDVGGCGLADEAE